MDMIVIGAAEWIRQPNSLFLPHENCNSVRAPTPAETISTRIYRSLSILGCSKAACTFKYVGRRCCCANPGFGSPRSPFALLSSHSDEMAATTVFKSIIDIVEESDAQEPPKKRICTNSPGGAKALWWDMSPIDSELSSSFEELLETIVKECDLQLRSGTLQDVFDCACLALTKDSGSRISLLVLENSHLLARDFSVLGRWMTLQKCLNSAYSATKVILIGSQGLLDQMWLDASLSVHLPYPPATRSLAHARQGDDVATTPSDDYSSDFSSTSHMESRGEPIFPLELLNIDFGWSSDLPWEPSAVHLGRVEFPHAHPSLEEIYDCFVTSRKRKYDTALGDSVQPGEEQQPAWSLPHVSRSRPT